MQEHSVQGIYPVVLDSAGSTTRLNFLTLGSPYSSIQILSSRTLCISCPQPLQNISYSLLPVIRNMSIKYWFFMLNGMEEHWIVKIQSSLKSHLMYNIYIMLKKGNLWWFLFCTLLRKITMHFMTLSQKLTIRYNHSSVTKCYMLVLETNGEKWVLKPRHKLN